MKSVPSTIITIAGLAAGRWLMAIGLLCAEGVGVRAAEPTFTNVTATVTPGLPQVEYSSVAWADIDNDGRLDFLITGITPDGGGFSSGTNITQLWRNTVSGFTNVTASVAPGLPGVSYSSVAWGDYDNDGRLDFLLTGYSDDGFGEALSQLWRNTGSGFTNVTAAVAPGLPGVSGGSVAWGDFDNDGRLDFLLTGHTGYTSNGHGIFISQIWRNTGSGFTNVTATVAPGLPGVYLGSVAWGDFDNDGRLDFLLTGGIDDALTAVSQLWRNTGSGFVNVTPTVAPGLTPVVWGSVAWADYDNDGRLDFLLTGYSRNYPWTIGQLWKNALSGFADVTTTVAPGLPGVVSGSVAWGDYDNDGRLDLLLTGGMMGGTGSQIWRNTPGGFRNVTASVAPGLPGVTYCSVAWGDSDNDGRLDFLLTGALDRECDVCETVSQLWRNNTPQTNPAPVVITKMLASVTPTSATLSGAINPQGQSMTAWFIWGNSPNYDHITPAQPMGSGNSLVHFAETITGLSPGWANYRAVGSNEQGQIFLGIEQYFYPWAPLVSAIAAGNVTANSATLKAEVWPQPNNLPMYGWFEWGVAPAYDQVTPVRFLGGFGLNTAFSERIFGLESGIAYYFRGVASNGLGVAYGPVRPLYTLSTNVPACRGSISPAIRLHGHGGGTGYQVRFSVQCAWTAVNTNSWITIASATSGPAASFSLTYNVARNLYAQPRTGAIVIGGHVLWITQGAGHLCTYNLSASSASFGSLSATGSVTLNSLAPTCPWGIVNTNPWVVVLSSVTNRGNGTVVYALAANPTTTERSGRIFIADQIFTITQSGGSSTNPGIPLKEALDTEGLLSWRTIGTPSWFGQTLVSHDGVDAAQSGPVTNRSATNSSAVTAASVINGPGTLSFWWKVSSETNKDFLKFFVNGVQQTRISGEVDWQLRSYTFSSGTYTSKWTYSKNWGGTVGNDRGWLDQVRFVHGAAGGPVMLSPGSSFHPNHASYGFFNVAAGAGRAWSVLNTNSWIFIVSGANGIGNGSVTYIAAANPSPSVRRGYLQIADQSFQVYQSLAGTNAPRLQFLARTATNATLSVQGRKGKMYIVEGSADLIGWTPISTNPASSIVTDTTVGNAPQRFYRTVEIP